MGFLSKQVVILSNSLRQFSGGIPLRDEESGRLEQPKHRVNNLEKRFLVWTKKYKTVDEVPTYVSQNVMERARNRMRIRIANYMMAATAIGCILMVISGKRAAEKGDSVSKQNIEWHKQMKENIEAGK